MITVVERALTLTRSEAIMEGSKPMRKKAASAVLRSCFRLPSPSSPAPCVLHSFTPCSFHSSNHRPAANHLSILRSLESITMSTVTDQDFISSTEAAEVATEEVKQVVEDTKEVDAPVVPVSNKSFFSDAR